MKKNILPNKKKKFFSIFLLACIVASCAKLPPSNPLGNMPVNTSSELGSFAQDSFNPQYTGNSNYSDLSTNLDEEKAGEILQQEMSVTNDREDFQTNNLLNAPSYQSSVKMEIAPGINKFSLQLKKKPGFIKKMFEPSGLTFDSQGNLYTIADKNLSVFKLLPSGQDYTAESAPSINKLQLLKLRFKKKNHFDFEGVVYHKDLFYCIDERDRKLYTVDRSGNINELKIDIDGYLQANGLVNNKSNSGPEGLAIDPQKNRLFIIKERQENAVLVADLDTLKITGHFKVSLPGSVEPTLTDAFYFEDSLFVLVRSHRQILKINPENGNISEIYDYRRYEEDENNVYLKIPAFGEGNDPQGYGVMEGLAVTKDSFYVVSDNNLLPLKKQPFKNQPQLFVFQRP